MKEKASRHAEPTSITSSERKRKLQDEQLETPFPKQVCRDHHLDRDKLAKGGGESDPESTNSNYAYSFMSCDDDDDKTDGGFQETHTSEEASTSSASWAGTSSDGLYSSGNFLSINSSTSERESLSMNEHQEGQDYQNKRHVVPEIDCYTDKELENLLYSNGVAPRSSYILSSGRWSVDQGAEAKQEGKKKLTIDKEFEQYFSMLML